MAKPAGDDRFGRLLEQCCSVAHTGKLPRKQIRRALYKCPVSHPSVIGSALDGPLPESVRSILQARVGLTSIYGLL